MRFLTEKKYRAIQEGHASEVAWLTQNLDITRDERDYYREARERSNDSRHAAVSVAKDVSDKLVQAQKERDDAREERDEAIRYEEAANRNYLRCLENEGRHITELNEARSKRDTWAHKTIELGKQNDVQAETIRLLQGETATLRNSVNYFVGAAQTANAERNEAREERDSLKGQLDAAEQELKIVRIIHDKSVLLSAEIDKMKAEYSAKQADTALDSLRTAR